jgi:hypothetical protein
MDADSIVGAEYDENDVFVQYVTVNIEDIKVGDLVYSYDTITGEVTQKEVTAVFVRESDHINYLTILDEQGREQVIETTDSHPFWVVTDNPDLERAAREIVDENGVILYHENIAPGLNGFWVEAKDLREGDVFLGANGELSTLVAAERVVFPDGIKVYNFTVDGNHNYFVIAATDEFGQTCILVHNACWHEHHIVMKGEFSGWKDKKALNAVKNSQKLLEKYRIDINDKVNMVRALNQGHTKEYAIKVWKTLQTAEKNAKANGLTKTEAVLKALAGMKEKIAQNGNLGAI